MSAITKQDPGTEIGAPQTSKRRRDPLGRAFEILRKMLEDPGATWGVRQVAREIGMNHSTAHRILGMLEQEGIVEATPAGEYRPALELYRIAWRASALHPLRNLALPIIRQLSDDSGETALLGLYEPARREMVFVASVESPHPLRYVVELNAWQPIYAGATGRAILAFLPEWDIQEVLRSPLVPLTPNTSTNARDIREGLAQVRSSGYALTRGERIEGAVGIAAPVFGPGGTVIGDVALTLPEARFDTSMEGGLSKLVMSAAERVTYLVSGNRPQSVAAEK